MLNIMLNKETNAFFDVYAHNHDYNKDPSYYDWLGRCIQLHGLDRKPIRVLDVGCGSGGFIKALAKLLPDAEFIGIDPSKEMIKLASEHLKEFGNVALRIMDGFEIQEAFNDKTFDLIHIDAVLHHLIAPTRAQSKQLASRLMNILSKKGKHIIVGEVYYNAKAIDGLTACLIFYGLKFAKLLKIDIGFFIKEYKRGLETNFYTERSLKKLLEGHGDIQLLKKQPFGNLPSIYYKVFALKEAGSITLLLQK